MKKIFLIIFAVISINSFGQAWSDHQVDSTLTLLMPDNYKVMDTLGQRVITAQIDNGLVLISAIPNAGEISMNVQSEAGLIKSYKGFVKGYINSQRGQLIKDEIIENSGLKMIRFSFKATMNGERQIRHSLAVFVNDKMYSINFWEVESMTKEMSEIREKLFSSLRFSSNLGLNNQMSNKADEERAYNLGYLLGKITIFGSLIGLVIWVITRGRKKMAKA